MQLLVSFGRGAGQKAITGLSCCVFLQVPREDPCEFCLCLDGELFCWWQDCPPCGGSRPSSTCGMASSGGNIHRTLSIGIEERGSGCEFWPEAGHPDWGFSGYAQYFQTVHVLPGVI